MSFFLKWLRPQTSARVGLRPRRDVDIPQTYDVAYERVKRAIEAVLGANLYVDDPAAGAIEAGFGLVNSERVRCSFERVGDATTRVRIEAHFPAGAAIPERSRAVDALANYLAAASG